MNEQVRIATEKFQAVLEEQLKRKHIDSITVNDIIADVGVSRTTFYRHFEDKFALVNWIYGQYRFMNY